MCENNYENYIEFLLEKGSECEIVEERQKYIKIAKALLELSTKTTVPTPPLTINWPKPNDYQMPNYTQPILTCHDANPIKKEGI